MYAADPRARINLGIRRRLAPLLENDRDRIKLMNSLLLSMPGTPVLYYGDEIGMGDNIFLGDRDGVRTPMQWTQRPQRRLLARRPAAAVPAADPGPDLRLRGGQRRGAGARRLVAAELDAPHARRAPQQPGLRPRPLHVAASGQPQDPGLPARATTTRSCCAWPTSAAPRSRWSSSWRAYKGRVPVEMLGRNAVPADRRPALPADAAGLRLLLVPPGHRRRRRRAGTPSGRRSRTCRCWCCSTAGTASSATASCRGASAWPRRRARSSSARCCRRYFVRQRWYAAKAETLERVDADRARPARPTAATSSGCSRWPRRTAPSGVTRYFVPLALAWEDDDEERTRRSAPRRSPRCASRPAWACWPTRWPTRRSAARWCARSAAAARSRPRAARCGSRPARLFDTVAGAALFEPMPVRRLTTSSNSVSLLGDRLFLKAYRRLQPGESPELEMGRFLTDVVALRARRAGGRQPRASSARRAK